MSNEFSLKKVAVFIILIVVLITIPLTVYLAQRQQEIRSRAAGESSPTPTPTPVPTTSTCYECTTFPDVTADSTWAVNGDGTITIRTKLSKNFVDNTYGSNAIGWPASKGHTFGNLTGSDELTLALYDKSDVKRMEFEIDYLSASTGPPSGYKSLCVSGGDGSMTTGNASDVVRCKTSLDENLNTFGYVLTTNSPTTDTNYTPNPAYPNWIYDVWYEVTVKSAPFATGGGFKGVLITNIHASPSKKGQNTCPVVQAACETTPTPTPTNTPTPTLTPTPIPSLTPKPSLTPTPPICVAPKKVTNVKVTCPNCFSSPEE